MWKNVLISFEIHTQVFRGKMWHAFGFTLKIFFLSEREREHVQARAHGGRERKSPADSPLSAEPHVGLHPTTYEITAWTEMTIQRLKRATQAPLTWDLLKNVSTRKRMGVYRKEVLDNVNCWDFSCIIWISSRDLMYSMVTTPNNSVLYTRKLLRD